MDSLTLTVRLPGPRVRLLAAGLATSLLVAMVAAPLLGPRGARAAEPATPPQRTISVTGSATVVTAPDTADIRLGVSSTRPTVKAARAEAAAAMTRIIAALKALGIADRDIQTAGLSLQPAYDYNVNANPPKISGYTLTNEVVVIVRDLDRVGDVIDDSLSAGATTLSGVSFRVDDPAAAQRQARTDAMTQAKARADTLAAAAGVTISGVASITETSAPPPYPIFFGGGAAPVKDGATPVLVGATEVTINVSVVYLIG